jgi:hypothetical protein
MTCEIWPKRFLDFKPDAPSKRIQLSELGAMVRQSQRTNDDCSRCVDGNELRLQARHGYLGCEYWQRMCHNTTSDEEKTQGRSYLHRDSNVYCRRCRQSMNTICSEFANGHHGSCKVGRCKLAAVLRKLWVTSRRNPKQNPSQHSRQPQIPPSARRRKSASGTITDTVSAGFSKGDTKGILAENSTPSDTENSSPFVTNASTLLNIKLNTCTLFLGHFRQS